MNVCIGALLLAVYALFHAKTSGLSTAAAIQPVNSWHPLLSPKPRLILGKKAKDYISIDTRSKETKMIYTLEKIHRLSTMYCIVDWMSMLVEYIIH